MKPTIGDHVSLDESTHRIRQGGPVVAVGRSFDRGK